MPSGVISPCCHLQAHSEQQGKDRLDSKSFSLLQNAQAMLASGDAPPPASLASSASQAPAVPPRRPEAPAVAAAAPSPVRLALPGHNVRIATDPPAVARPAVAQHVSPGSKRRQERGSNSRSSKPPAQPKGAAAAPVAAEDAPPTSAPSSGSEVQSRLTLRIASMHQKFAAAAQLLQKEV